MQRSGLTISRKHNKPGMADAEVLIDVQRLSEICVDYEVRLYVLQSFCQRCTKTRFDPQ